MSDLTSRELALAERSCESFAWTHGWVETWTLDGKDAMVYGEGEREERRKREERSR